MNVQAEVEGDPRITIDCDPTPFTVRLKHPIFGEHKLEPEARVYLGDPEHPAMLVEIRERYPAILWRPSSKLLNWRSPAASSTPYDAVPVITDDGYAWMAEARASSRIRQYDLLDGHLQLTVSSQGLLRKSTRTTVVIPIRFRFMADDRYLLRPPSGGGKAETAFLGFLALFRL